MLIMALNGVCGKTSSEDTLKYIIGSKESYSLVTNLPPSIHFQLCTTYILKTLPQQERVSQVAFWTFSDKRNVE